VLTPKILCAFVILVPSLQATTVVWDNSSEFLCASYSCFFRLGDPIADDFQLTAPASITSMLFWATESVWPLFDGTVGWAFYTDNGSGPDTLLYSGTDYNLVPVDTGLTAGQGGYSIRTIGLDFGGIDLGSGTYWIALRDGAWGTPSVGTNLGWLEATRAVLPGGIRTGLPDNDPTTWNTVLGTQAFTLSAGDPAPEPATFILIIPVLIIGGLRWRSSGKHICRPI
jgi:hypothetical protein